jgi:diacylglycerol kinase (ATP)
MSRVFVIVNPISGRGHGEKSIPAMESHFRRLGVDTTLVRTERPGHGDELAAGAVRDGSQIVVSAGGDGTANEVLNGVIRANREGNRNAALAVLCVGRGNDFAFGAGISRSLEEGCLAIAEDRRRRIDVGRVTGGLYPQGRCFGNGVGIGFDAVVGFEALKLKALSGFLCYAVAAVKTISLYNRPHRVKIVCDGETWFQDVLMVSLMNGRRMGGGFMMAPEGDPGDGRLNYCIAAGIRRRRLLPLLLRFMKGNQAGHPAIRMGTFRKISVTALEGALPAHADGETLCVEGTELEIEILPSALDIIIRAPA